MNKYLEYKDSGFEWIGPIPVQWALRRVMQIFSERQEKVDDKTFPPLSVTMNGVVDQLPGIAKTDHSNNRKLVKKGDFVINSRSDRKGSSGISPRDGSVSIINIVMEPRKSNPSFYEHLFKSFYFQEEFFRNGKGIVWDLWSTKWDQLKVIQIPVPPQSDQALISNYLYKKTSQIDSLIEKIERKIELLKEQRTSLINQCVTKGLNPEVEMKDSGVEWIGEIPNHWMLLPVKFLVETPITDGPHETPEFIDDGVPFLSVESVVENKLVISRMRGYISRDLHEEYSKKCKPRRNDIFLVKSGSTTGKSAIVETDEEFNVWSPLCLIRSDTRKIRSQFFFQSLQSDYFRKSIELAWSFGTQPNIGMNVIKDLKIILPPLNEQASIITELKPKLSIFDKIVEKENKRINLLKEYRQSLISNTVTGKIRITEEMI